MRQRSQAVGRHLGSGIAGAPQQSVAELVVSRGKKWLTATRESWRSRRVVSNMRVVIREREGVRV